MIQLPGYLVESLLYENRQSRIYRGTRTLDGVRVILKVLNEDFPSPERRARFVQEYKLMRKLQSDAILPAFAMESRQGMQVMVLEDFGGTSLNNLDLGATLPLNEWLQLALRIADCLDQLHQQHVMHKDINPSNIVWNRETNQIKLIDLGIATELTREVPEIRNPDCLEGTLAYSSPEQTGRMNRAMDYRTDFYSLGVTMYELLLGELPFHSRDALELVHAHIAKQPPLANQINPRIPEMPSEIIRKLMEKTAEARYQTAAGLKADLKRCLQTLDADGHIPAFPLGEQDFSGRLQISQRLVGRDTQMEDLLAAFDRASSGRAELLLIAGYSGIGKSALVHEIQKPITRRRGYFIEGKFDQFKNDIPYAAFTQAFEELIRQLLTEGESVVAMWKDKLSRALGHNGQVIVDVIPNVEWLIGPQPPIPSLPAEQEQNRFNHEFRNFVGTFAAEGHPLVFFLDDLQWADLPTLQLMSSLLRPPALPNLLLIGAYRDNEITPAHPLSLALHGMEKSGAIMQTVTLLPLDFGDVTALLSDTLLAEASEVRELAQLCLAKTQGNPFFLGQFLGALADRKILCFDAERSRWQWDILRIEQADITDNIVDLLVAKLHTLPVAVRNVLQGAACLGNVFDLKMLSVVCGQSEEETASVLWPALQEELIVPLDDRYKYANQAASANEISLLPSYRFLHDRVQQAAYLLSTEDAKITIHLVIGRLLLKVLSPAEQQAMLFSLVNHLNLGRSQIVDHAEHLQLARLNLQAARRAKASIAYKPALLLLQTALELVTDDDWQQNHGLMLELHIDAAEAAYLSADLPKMERTIAVALAHSTDLLDRAKLVQIRIHAYITEDKSQEAVLKGLEMLELLGISFPKNPKTRHVLASLVHTKIALRGKSIDDLGQLPTMSDPKILAASNILLSISSAAYYTMPVYFPLLLFKAIRLSLAYGHGPGSAYNFSALGAILASSFGAIKQGARYAALALTIAERPEQAAYAWRAVCSVHGVVHPWIMPLHDILDPLINDHLRAVEVGDLEYAGNAATIYCFYAFYCGHELSALEQETANFGGAIERSERSSVKNELKVLRQAMLNLMGQSADPRILQGTAFDERKKSDTNLGRIDITSTFVIFNTKLSLCYQFGAYHEAMEHALTAGRHLKATVGLFGRCVYYFYDSLVRLALLADGPANQRASTLRQVKRNQKKLQHWAKHTPANFLHKWHLVEAETSRRTGDALTAIDSYEQAIRLARENNFLHEEALAQELAGEFYLARGMKSIARMYLKEAQNGYRRWGALAKVRDLAERYPHWLGQSAQLISTHTTVTTAHTSTSSANVLDFETVMKASQALSQEIVLERLLKRLMHVVLESAGAQRAVLLLKKEKDWFVEAEKSEDQAEATVLQSIVLDDRHAHQVALPMSLVRYVANTRESIVIHDAQAEKLVANDPYVQQHRLHSLLVVPILNQGEIAGILYMENNAASGAFTESRLEVLQLLASQAAISIENARLYADMEALARANQIQAEQQTELTRFLAVASHDLRQPMHALNLYLGALSNFDLPASARPVLGNVRQCAQIMDGMFLALLDMSRLDAQLVKPLCEPFPIAPVMARLAVEFAPPAEAKGIAFHITSSADWVQSDVTLVEQVLRNLLANAVRYTEAGDIAITCARHGDLVRVSVRDTGIGISPHQQKTVFEDFCQVRPVGRDRTEGLGLGLAIVRRLSHLLGMPVTLVSAQGRGSTFAIDLPWSGSQVAALASPGGSTHGGAMLSGKLIVVVDDEQTILDAMRVLLEQWGCTVVTAVSGSDALTKLANVDRVPDVLICDYRLNFNETGLEVIDLLWSEFNSEISALLITGDAAPDRIQEILASGLPVLHKPVQTGTLLEALVELISVQSNF